MKIKTTQLLKALVLWNLALAAPYGYAEDKDSKDSKDNKQAEGANHKGKKHKKSSKVMQVVTNAGSTSELLKNLSGSQEQARAGAGYAASAHNIQYTSVAPGARGQKQSSVDARQDFDASISSLSKADMLDKVRAKDKNIEESEAVQTTSIKESKKKTAALAIGNYRTKDLTEGFVSAPGITDFAAYFRATGKDFNSERLGGNYKPGSMDAENFKIQAAAENLRVETVDSIKKILLNQPTQEQKIDLLMRLAEIQIERHAYALEAEIKTYNAALEQWRANPKGSEPVFKTTRSDAQILAGIDSLRTVVTQFPNHERSAEALFNLGLLLTQTQSNNAPLYFDRLIKRFPKSQFIPDAWLSLGEYHFSKNQYDKALTSYQKILEYKNSRAYSYAVYKLGWTYFNFRNGGEDEFRKNLGKSLAAFKLVVRLADTTPNNPILKGLRKDALRDMVLVFADLGDIVGAQTYFESLGETELYTNMLERLAWQYSEKGEFATAIQIYGRLISENSTSPRLPIFYSKLPELYEKLGQVDNLLDSFAKTAVALSPNSPWMQKNGKDTEAVSARDKYFGKALKGYAEKFHVEAQKGKSKRRFDDALTAYSLYLDYFGDREESYSAHFFKAEILVVKNKFLDAADEYMKAAFLDDKFNLKGKYTNTALVNAIASVDKVIERSEKPKLPEFGKAAEKIPLPVLHAKLVLGIDTFVKMFPADSQVLEFSHRAASILYSFGDYANARTRWIALAQKFPKSPEVYDGLRSVLKVFIEKKDWESAIADCRAYLKLPAINDTKLEKSIISVLKGATFSKAVALETEGKKAAAAEVFLSYHKEFQDDLDAPNALFNAANNFFKIGRTDDAIATLRILLAQYPKSSLVPNVNYLIASSYDALGKFDFSAASYEQIVHDSPKNPVGPDALMRATEQRFAIGEYENALKDAHDFQVLYPTTEGIGEAYFIAGKSHLRLNNKPEAIKSFISGAERILASNPAYSLYLYGLSAQTAMEQEDKARAQQIVNNGLSLWNRLDSNGRTAFAWEGIRNIACTQTALLDDKLPLIMAKSITDGLQIVPQFTAIRDEANGLSQKYATVAKLGNAEAAVGALYRIAEIQEFLANTLLNTPVPKDASPDEVEEFKGNIEQIAIPLQEEASNLYFVAWQKSNESEAITAFGRKLHDKLSVLKPGDFKKVIEELPASAYYNSELLLTRETTKLAK